MPVPMAPTCIRLCGSRWAGRGVVGGHVDVADGWDRRIPYVGALTCGLALTNQHTIVLLEVPLIMAVLVTGRDKLLRPAALSGLVILFLLGLLPYVYLPIVGRLPPLGSWGGVDTWEGFLRHVLRQEYGSLQLYTTGTVQGDNKSRQRGSATAWHDVRLKRLVDNGKEMTLSMVRESRGGCLLLAPLGFGYLVARPCARTGARAVGIVVLACLALYCVVFLPLANLPATRFFRPILARFWMQPYQLVCLLMGAGLQALLEMLPPRSVQGAAASSSTLLSCSGVAVVGWIGAMGAANVEACQSRHTSVVHDMALALLHGIPKGGIALCTGDLHYYPLLYLQACEGVRQDAALINTAMIKGVWFASKQGAHYANVTWPDGLYSASAPDCSGYEYNIRCFLDANLGRPWASSAGGKSGKTNGKGKGKGKKKKRKQSPKDASDRPEAVGGGEEANTPQGECGADAAWRPNSGGQVMLAGKWPPGDESYSGHYHAWPHGLLQQVFPLPPPPSSAPSRRGGDDKQGAERRTRDGTTLNPSMAREATTPSGCAFANWARRSASHLPPFGEVQRLRWLAQESKRAHLATAQRWRLWTVIPLPSSAKSWLLKSWLLACLSPPPSLHAAPPAHAGVMTKQGGEGKEGEAAAQVATTLDNWDLAAIDLQVAPSSPALVAAQLISQGALV
jgi:hypothetical protein